MGDVKTKLPKATIIRLFKDAGAERVSADVADAVNKILLEIAKGAVKAAKAEGKKTVSADNLKMVVVVT
ncbi:MAG: NFYB/HAP3 family transcription factor subunit [Candidatus Hadarchaeales archaeon]